MTLTHWKSLAEEPLERSRFVLVLCGQDNACIESELVI